MLDAMDSTYISDRSKLPITGLELNVLAICSKTHHSSGPVNKSTQFINIPTFLREARQDITSPNVPNIAM